MSGPNASKPIDHARIIGRLERNIDVYKGLIGSVEEEEARWREAPGKWNLLEIVCHLFDEEREDFRARLWHALETPALELAPIDPEGWVSSRRYDEEDYQTSIARFLHERENSVQRLRSLDRPDWKSAYVHPRYGPMSAEFFLVNWLAHDMLHIRQILRVRYHYLETSTNTTLLYAGGW